MRSSSMTTAAFALLSGLSVVSASYPLATITPCPSCPKGVCDEPITVTSQYQPVSTCAPVKSCAKGSCTVTASCSTYDYVSTVIPCLGGKESTTVTETDQMVKLSHVSTVLTSYYPVPCPTQAPAWNGTYPQHKGSDCTSTKYQTMVVDTSCPYNKIGPMAIPSYEGSGLCKDCATDVNGTESQGVHVSKCIDGNCSTYAETWVSKKAAPATSASVASYSSSAYCSAGVNTIPVTTVCTPTGAAYETPVTSSFHITTSVAQPQNVVITTVFTVYFTGKEPASVYPTSTAAAPVQGEDYCTRNGAHTAPIVHTIYPSNSAYAPVTTTVTYTTTVTNAPVHVTYSTTLPVIYTTTPCRETVVSGSTVQPTGYPTGPASYSAYPTYPASSGGAYPTYPASSDSGSYPTYPVSSSGGSYPTYPASSSGASYPTYPASSGGVTYSTYPTSTLMTSTTSYSASTTPTPSPPATVGKFDFYGCLGSTKGFPTFNLLESSGLMTVDLCTTECLASGFNFAGLYTTDCYCASSVDDGTGSGQTYGVCDIPCPGNPLQTCGGNALASSKLRSRNVPSGILLDVYECPTPTTSSSTTSTESSTTSYTPNPSSDPDVQPEPRNINADMESSTPVKARDDGKMRRGGMLRNTNKAVKGPALAKRDYGPEEECIDLRGYLLGQPTYLAPSLGCWDPRRSGPSHVRVLFSLSDNF